MDKWGLLKELLEAKKRRLEASLMDHLSSGNLRIASRCSRIRVKLESTKRTLDMMMLIEKKCDQE